MKEHRLGFPKIGRDLQIDLRSPSYGAHNVADFRHFRTEFSERITDKPWSLAIYPATNMFIWTRIVYKGRFKKCNLIQSAENDVTKRANLSKIGTFKPFINLVQTSNLLELTSADPDPSDTTSTVLANDPIDLILGVFASSRHAPRRSGYI